MGNRRPLRRASVLLGVSLLVPAATGCITSALWEHSNSLRGKKVTAAVLTPFALAADAAITVGVLGVLACAGAPPAGAAAASPADPAQSMRDTLRDEMARDSGR